MGETMQARGSDVLIAERSATADGRLSIIGALTAMTPLPAVNRGDVWVVAVMELVYALTTIADGDVGDVLAKWRVLTADAPVTYVARVLTALEEA